LPKEKGICCPKCGSDDTEVKDKRAYAGTFRRRRKCLKCNFDKIKTIEKVIAVSG
jgi:transcriptional regulator NrdR family protein